MEKEWVDFKTVKAAVTMQMVLDHYGINGLKRVGNDLRGKCPIHKGTGNDKHLSVNLNKNAFKCFSANCGARGNVLDFVAAMENCSIRDAALKLQGWFKIGESGPRSPQEDEHNSEAHEVPRGIYRDKDGAFYELITAATCVEDLKGLVVYRELFGDYKFWIAPVAAFGSAGPNRSNMFTLVKRL